MELTQPSINLPDDCLFIIFRKLKCYTDRNCFGLTCRQWLHIQNSARTSLTFHHSLKHGDFKDCVVLLPKLLIRFPNLSSISLASFADLPDLALSRLKDSGNNLRCLSLYCCFGITDMGVSIASMECPHLVSITLYRCNITDTGLESLAKSCMALENINISYCIKITDRGIHFLSRYCCKMQTVIISYSRGITGSGFGGCSPALAYLEADSCSLTPEGLVGALSGGGLEYLNVSNLKSWLERDALDSIGAGFATRLRYLNLRMCRFVGDSSVAAIASGCPLLEEWNLAVCHEVRLAGWDAIGSNCNSLRILHVNRCRNLCDRGLQSLREGCSKMKLLYVHGCRRVTHSGLEMFKLVRQDVELKRDECVSVGPCLEKFFTPHTSNL